MNRRSDVAGGRWNNSLAGGGLDEKYSTKELITIGRRLIVRAYRARVIPYFLVSRRVTEIERADIAVVRDSAIIIDEGRIINLVIARSTMRAQT